MAVKASASITVAKERDISSVTRFYKIAASSSTPSQPTGIADPSGWSKAEPSYDGTSTNSLYITDRTIFSDGTASWSDVSKSSSYEAAKQAYNEAQEAKKTATNFMQTVSGGVWVTPSDKKPDSSGNATSTTRGVRITDQIDVFRGTKSVAQFGESVVIGVVENGKLNILLETTQNGDGRFMFRNGLNENFGIIVDDVQFDLLGGGTTTLNDIRIDDDDILLKSTRELNVTYENDSEIYMTPEELSLRLTGKNSSKAYIDGYLSDDYTEGYINVFADNWAVDSDGVIDCAGGYKVGGDPLFKIANCTKDNISISKTSTASGTITPTAYTGYTPIGVIGYDLNNASSSGQNLTTCVPLAIYFSSGTVSYQIRNNSSANTAKIKVIARVLYVRSELI